MYEIGSQVMMVVVSVVYKPNSHSKPFVMIYMYRFREGHKENQVRFFLFFIYPPAQLLFLITKHDIVND
jgi:hypothetical protein